MTTFLTTITNKIKNENLQLKKYTLILPDDRKCIQIGGTIKYVNINNIQKIKTGKIIDVTNDILMLKSLNSNAKWIIKFVENYIFYKFNNDNLIDAINELFEKNEKIN